MQKTIYELANWVGAFILCMARFGAWVNINPKRPLINSWSQILNFGFYKVQNNTRATIYVWNRYVFFKLICAYEVNLGQMYQAD